MILVHLQLLIVSDLEPIMAHHTAIVSVMAVKLRQVRSIHGSVFMTLLHFRCVLLEPKYFVSCFQFVAESFSFRHFGEGYQLGEQSRVCTAARQSCWSIARFIYIRPAIGRLSLLATHL